jgi:predicted MPP superfamily phosphohydrolase
VFGTVLISICTFMHIYVFWRVGSVPFVVRRVPRAVFFGFGLTLWILFFLGRVIGHDGGSSFAGVLEFIGMTWMAVLFLTFITLAATDLLTLFGLFFPRLAASLRGWALLVGLGLSMIALFQGLRPPVVVRYEVALPGLPKALDGTVVVALSDMHLGSQLGSRWAAARVDQVNGLQPDLVVLLGDIFEGHGFPEASLLQSMRGLSAPMGVWAVPGNHEFHGKGNLRLFDGLKFRLLRNSWAEIRPGLVLVGVDDLTAKYRNGQGGDGISEAFAGRPGGATVFLSHTPWRAEEAAGAGAGLMLSGHTHGGQIWPFGYLVKNRYPLFAGQYEVNRMTVIVCRGAGAWGPRMRLWHPGEILLVTLRSKA